MTAGDRSTKLEFTTSLTDAALLDTLCACLRGEPVDMLTLDEPTGQRLVDLSIRHGVQSLLYRRLNNRSRVLPTIMEQLNDQAHAQAVLSLSFELELARISSSLFARNIKFLLLKGTPLAYQYYDSPSDRPRADIDLLVEEEKVHETRLALQKLGFYCDQPITPFEKGLYLSTQFLCQRRQQNGLVCELDVHWRASNAVVFADCFHFEEFHRTKVPIPQLGKHAFSPSPPHNLLLACMHRVTEQDKNRLIWIYDIHLLLQHMNQHTFADTVDLALKKKIACVLLDNVELSYTTFNTQVSLPLVEDLKERVASNDEKASRLMLRPERGHLTERWADFVSLSDWRQKTSLLYTACFPPRSYLKAQGVEVNRWNLIWIYLKRFFFFGRSPPS